MSYEHKPNSGTLFPNDRKEKDTHPDFKGSAKVGGIDYWVSGWKNEKDGQPRLGLAFQVKNEKPEEKQADVNPFG